MHDRRKLEKKRRGGPGISAACQERDPQTGRIKSLDLTRSQAFERYCAEPGNITLKAFKGILNAEGITISYGCLQKWSAKHNWRKRRDVRKRGLDTAATHERLEQLSTMAKAAGIETMDGLIVKAMETISRGLDEVEINTPNNVVTMVHALDNLVAVRTSFREAMVPMAPSTMEGPDEELRLPAIDAPRIGDFKGCVIEGGEAKR